MKNIGVKIWFFYIIICSIIFSFFYLENGLLFVNKIEDYILTILVFIVLSLICSFPFILIFKKILNNKSYLKNATIILNSLFIIGLSLYNLIFSFFVLHKIVSFNIIFGLIGILILNLYLKYVLSEKK